MHGTAHFPGGRTRWIEPPVLDRVLRVLPLLEREERISLARAALALEAP